MHVRLYILKSVVIKIFFLLEHIFNTFIGVIQN